MFIFVFLFLLIGCAGSVGISLASRVMYILCVCFRCVECRAGTILTGHFGGVGGGTVRIFLSLWLCSGGYGTVEMVRGGGPFFLCFLQFAVSSLGGWMSAVGILCYIFFVGSFVVFSRGFLFYKLLIFQQFITGGFVAVRT
jgi:hypothetical protein